MSLTFFLSTVSTKGKSNCQDLMVSLKIYLEQRLVYVDSGERACSGLG